MASIAGMSVPRKAHEPLRALSELTDDQFDQLEQTLAGANPQGASPRALTALVEALDQPVGGAQARDFVSSLFSLIALHFTHSWPVRDVAHGVATNGPLGLTPAQAESVEPRLAKLLVLPNVSALAKATSIAYEHANLFHTARVMSDIRPVFGDDANRDPAGAMISHILRLDFFGSRAHDEIFIAMTRDDLNELSQAVVRAIEKDTTLRRVINRAELDELDATFE